MKTYYTLTLLLFIIMITGCKSSKNLSVNPTQEIEEYRYLDFRTPYDTSSYALWDNIPLEDREIIAEAFSRLTLKKGTDGTYEWFQKSGKEVNISERLFEYFQNTLSHSNNAEWKKGGPVYNEDGKLLIR